MNCLHTIYWLGNAGKENYIGSMRMYRDVNGLVHQEDDASDNVKLLLFMSSTSFFQRLRPRKGWFSQ